MIKYYTTHNKDGAGHRNAIAVICNSCKTTIYVEDEPVMVEHLKHHHAQQLEDAVCDNCKKRKCV